MASSTKTIQYRYDAAGNRVGMTGPDGGRFTYAYDSLNRITHLENPQNERTSYQYDAAGRRTVKRLANGTRASFSYDDASDLTRLANFKSGGTTISSFGYQYDSAGNRTSVLEADGCRVTWSYDSSYQLIGEHRTGSNAYRNTFTYDAGGNRTLKNEDGQRTTYTYDAANQLATSQDALGTTTYTFDANGNQQLVESPAGNRTTTTWDYENRATLIELSGGIRNTMAYEPNGLRVKLEDSTGTRKFIWDEQNYLAETDDSNLTQVVYTNEPVDYGRLISQHRGSTTNWYHFDAYGSTHELTVANEVVTDTYVYNAWGSPVDESGATENPFRWSAQPMYYYDVDSGLFYVRQRSYGHSIARWTSVDPVGFIDALNMYMYAVNAPAQKNDPSGLFPWSLLLAPSVLTHSDSSKPKLPKPKGPAKCEWDAHHRYRYPLVKPGKMWTPANIQWCFAHCPGCNRKCVDKVFACGECCEACSQFGESVGTSPKALKALRGLCDLLCIGLNTQTP